MPAQSDDTSGLSTLTISDTERSTPDCSTDHRLNPTLLTLPAEIRLQVLRYVLERRILTLEDPSFLSPNIGAGTAITWARDRYCSAEIKLRICWGCHEPHVISTPQPRNTHILSACRMLYDEGRSVLYDDRVFCLSTRLTGESLVILEDQMYDQGIEVIRLDPSQDLPQRVLTFGLESNTDANAAAEDQVDYLFHLDQLRKVSHGFPAALLASHKLTLRFHMIHIPGHSTPTEAAMSLYNKHIKPHVAGFMTSTTETRPTITTSEDVEFNAVEEAMAADQTSGQISDSDTRPDWDDIAATTLWNHEIEQIRNLATTGVWSEKAHFYEQIHRTSHELFEVQQRLTWGRSNLSAQQNIKFFVMYRSVHYYAAMICLNLAHKRSDIKDSIQYAAKAIFHLTCIFEPIEVEDNHFIHHIGFDRNTDHIRAFIAASRMLWLEAIAWFDDDNKSMSCIETAVDAIARALQPDDWTKGAEGWRRKVTWLASRAKASANVLEIASRLSKQLRVRSCRSLVQEVWEPLAEKKWPYARRDAFKIPRLEEVDQW